MKTLAVQFPVWESGVESVKFIKINYQIKYNICCRIFYWDWLAGSYLSSVNPTCLTTGQQRGALSLVINHHHTALWLVEIMELKGSIIGGDVSKIMIWSYLECPTLKCHTSNQATFTRHNNLAGSNTFWTAGRYRSIDILILNTNHKEYTWNISVNRHENISKRHSKIFQ